MSRIDELIQQLCPDGVEYRCIGDFAECYAGATPKTSVWEYWQNGTIPWMSSGEVNKRVIYNTEKRITQEAYNNCSTKMIPANSVVIALAGQGKTRGLVAITKIELCTNQSLCAIVSHKSMNSSFLYHFLRSQYQQLRSVSSGDGTRGGLNLQMIKVYSVPVPPLPVQEEIVRILDKFTALEAELETELEAELETRRKQYEFYRDQLLTFGDEVEWKSLGEITTLKRGNVISKKYLREHSGIYPVYSSQTVNDGIFGKINTFDYNGNFLTWTTDGANAGSVFYRSGQFSITNVCGLIDLKSSQILLRFLFYWLRDVAPTYVNTGMGNPKLMSNVMATIRIPVPSLAEQERIVAILDKFDALVNDISSGLPAELEMRRKQYEYYRDRLLTFKPLAKEA